MVEEISVLSEFFESAKFFGIDGVPLKGALIITTDLKISGLVTAHHPARGEPAS